MLYYYKRVPKCSKRRLILIALFYWLLAPMLFVLWTNSNRGIIWFIPSQSFFSNITLNLEQSFSNQPFAKSFDQEKNEKANSILMTKKFILEDVDYEEEEMVNFMTEALISKNSDIPLNENGTLSPMKSDFVTVIPLMNSSNDDKNTQSDIDTGDNIGKYELQDLLPWKNNNNSYDDDRILLQLYHIPKNYMARMKENKPIKSKTIYFYGGLKRWGMPSAESYFKEHTCFVDNCDFITDSNAGHRADAIVFSNPGKLPWKLPWPRYSQKQIWALLMLESPFNTRRISDEYKNMFNWTMTYRRDSTISTPYQKIAISQRKNDGSNTEINMASGKTKKVAWFVSNCGLVRSGRMRYARELMKYIDVDIFGSCGNKRCPKRNMDKCFEILKKDYKFYLAFENSKCKHYVTEKLFHNALRNNVIPIVMGASPSDYRIVAPPGSFIHVEDFGSPKELANYLHKLDTNDNLFNRYFEWQSYGTFIDAAPWCRFCAMLHENNLPNTWYNDINDWWSAKSTCIGQENWPKTTRS